MHAPEEETDRHGVGDVRGRRDASTAGEEATDASEAVDDDRPRIPPIRERAGHGRVRG